MRSSCLARGQVARASRRTRQGWRCAALADRATHSHMRCPCACACARATAHRPAGAARIAILSVARIGGGPSQSPLRRRDSVGQQKRHHSDSMAVRQRSATTSFGTPGHCCSSHMQRPADLCRAYWSSGATAKLQGEPELPAALSEEHPVIMHWTIEMARLGCAASLRCGVLVACKSALLRSAGTSPQPPTLPRRAHDLMVRVTAYMLCFAHVGAAI